MIIMLLYSGIYLLKMGLLFSFTILLVIGVSYAIILSVMLLVTNQYYQKSEKYANGSQNNKYSPNTPHHGIIFVLYPHWREQLFIADCIHLLAEAFGENIPYKIYPVKNENDFRLAYENPNINWLWIFGHGVKDALGYSLNNKMELIEYSNYERKSNLQFIAQLHCNPGPGRSLPEINNLTPDYDITHFRFPFQNRCYIAKKTKEFIEK